MIDYNNLKEMQIEMSVDLSCIIPVSTDGHGIAPEKIKDYEQLTDNLRAYLEKAMKEELDMDAATITSYKCFLHEKENGND